MIDTKRTIATYRGWHALEKPRGVEIIDFDLIPNIQHQQDFDSRKEVLVHLIELRSNCDLRPKKTDEQFLKARFQASIYYLRALMGEDIPFSSYVTNTMGIRPRLIPKPVIEAQKRKVDDLLKDFGVPQKKSVRQFSEEIRIEQKEAEEEEKEAEGIYLSQFLHIMGWDELQFSYQVKFVEKQAYWTGWTRTIEDGSFELRFNFHPMHHWYKGDMEFLVLHEIGGHFIQMAHIKKAIRQGRINPALGLTMVHDPHAFGAEGTANANSYFLPEIKLSPFGVLAREQPTLP